MPLQQDSAHQVGHLQRVAADGVWSLTRSGETLTDACWQAALATLRGHEKTTAVLVLSDAGLHTQMFSDVWTSLPSRLASLAIRPPHAMSLVVRPNDAVERSLSRTENHSAFAMWRCLVELAKSDATVVIQHEAMTKPSVEAVAQEFEFPELMSLPPSQELEWLFSELHLARLSDLCGPVNSTADATAVLAGLWLLHGDADASHRPSQSIEDEGRHRCGNFWHAIMHRQEPDYGNSKYWFRRIGQHPIFSELARRAAELIAADGSDFTRRWGDKLGLPSRWDPFAFVDWIEAALSESDASQIRLLRRIQFLEMHLLLRATFEDATQPSSR